MNILKSMACTAVAAVGAYNLYLAADIQQEKSDLTFDTIELTASGAEAGGDVGSTVVDGSSIIWPTWPGWEPWTDDKPLWVDDYYGRWNSASPYCCDKSNKNKTNKTGVEVRIEGRQGGLIGYNDGHWQINGPVCTSAHYENGHKYKTEIVSLLCGLFGNECDGWRGETAHKETIYWDAEVK